MKIYIAGSFSNDVLKCSLLKMIRLARKNHPSAELFIPMEHKIEEDFQMPNGNWFLSNSDWANRVFKMDLENLVNSDMVFAMYTGHYGTTGTSWEIGFAYAQGIPIVLYIPDWTRESKFSLMILNCAKHYMDEKGNIKKITTKWLEQFNQK